MLTNTTSLEVGFGDCDPIGIVYYPNYFKWADVCFGRLMRSAGLPLESLNGRYGVRFPLLETNARFMAPCRPEDVLEVTSGVAECTGKTVRFSHLFRCAGAPCLEVSDLRVWARPAPDDPTRLKGAPIPDEVLAILRGEAA